MSEQEKNIIESLPSVQSITEEYARQGKALSAEEAERIREQIRKDMETGSVDAMDGCMSDDEAASVSGGAGCSPVPTKIFNPAPKSSIAQYDKR